MGYQHKLEPTGGNKTVTTGGTGEALVASSTLAHVLYIHAMSANTNPVFVGDSGVDKTTSKQITLSAGESIRFDAPEDNFFDLADWWVDVTTDGEGVDFLYIAEP